MNNNFGKEYKLCHKKVIDKIFTEGKSVRSFPFNLKYTLTESNNNSAPFQVVVSVPKKIFKKAHQRNAIKRLVRESIRLNKHELEQELLSQNKQLAFVLIYTHSEKLTLKELLSKYKKLNNKLINDIKK